MVLFAGPNFNFTVRIDEAVIEMDMEMETVILDMESEGA